ncbi:MAG: 16S rRNA (uracil(1498)-N(3))-methyltransferase [Muribaculaceae bacterium]|nr:16S rRNA (uracil(1498)-N(3))-methyltransferase [Muribaculaceae bacterium]
MIRFYAPDIESDGRLPEVESSHCCRVLRMREGDRIEVVDGKGNVYRCEIVGSHPKHTDVEIIDKESEPLHWAPRITLAVAPTKNMDRIEWMVEKAVEIGVNRIVFLDCLHSVRRTVKRERVEKIMVSAMKQSLKATMPELAGPVAFEDFVRSDTSSLRYMGYCDPSVERRRFEREYNGASDVTVLIGPEGDFSPEEVSLAINCGFMPVTFGNTRLRTETAAIYSLCAAHALIAMSGS